MSDKVEQKLLYVFMILIFAISIVFIVDKYTKIYKLSKEPIVVSQETIDMEDLGWVTNLKKADTDSELEYEIKDKTIATVDKTGKITSKKEGTTELIIKNVKNKTKEVITINVGKKAIEKNKEKQKENKKDNQKPNIGDILFGDNKETGKDETKTEEPKSEEPQVEEPKKEEPKVEEPKVEEPKKEEPKKEEIVYAKTIALSLNNISFTLNSKTINSAKITASIYPSNVTNNEVVWKNSNSSVATYSNGTITPVGPGKTTITVTSKDGHASDKIDVVVKKNVILVNGASQVTKMKNYYSSYDNGANKYSVNNGTIVFIEKSGSGIKDQYDTSGELYKSTKSNIEKYSSVKNYINFYLFYPLSGNTIKNFVCSDINSSNETIKGYVKGYSNSVSTFSNLGYNVKSFVVSMHPVKPAQGGDQVVTNGTTNSCKKGYRSNYKYYIFNNAIQSNVSNYSNIKYEEVFTSVMKVVEGNNKYSYKVTYNTTDGVHWDKDTTLLWTSRMFEYSGAL